MARSAVYHARRIDAGSFDRRKIEIVPMKSDYLIIGIDGRFIFVLDKSNGNVMLYNAVELNNASDEQKVKVGRYVSWPNDEQPMALLDASELMATARQAEHCTPDPAEMQPQKILFPLMGHDSFTVEVRPTKGVKFDVSAEESGGNWYLTDERDSELIGVYNKKPTKKTIKADVKAWWDRMEYGLY